MRIGYARTAANELDPKAQLQALSAAGFDRLYQDECVSGTSAKRPALVRALNALRAGDVLVVWKLDRLGGSLSHLVRLVRELGAQGVGLQSLTESIDTASMHGPRLLQLIGALAEFERSLIAERTAMGSAAARRRGVKAGRKPKLTDDMIARARQLIDLGERPVEVARSMNVSVATLYRHIPAAASNRTTIDLFGSVTS